MVTLPGEKMVARAGASIVAAAGAGAGIARTEAEYGELALRLARRKRAGALHAPGAALHRGSLEAHLPAPLPFLLSTLKVRSYPGPAAC